MRRDESGKIQIHIKANSLNKYYVLNHRSIIVSLFFLPIFVLSYDDAPSEYDGKRKSMIEAH